MSDVVARTVGRYEVLREVGRGGMAVVYVARQRDLDRFVALKELRLLDGADSSNAQRFLRESRVAGSLSHPNIVTVHDYFEHEGRPYIAMEFVDCGSLRRHIGRMSLAQISGVLEGLLAGLEHAEEHAIVHRDLKPENLMVTADGRVKIADFGIAKATTKMQTGAFATATGVAIGTPAYMAPEQAMAQDIGPWTDLYSVGCMAFEMFTGRVPFHDTETPMAVLMRHINEPIRPVRSVDPAVDEAISDWIETLLAKDVADRTQSAAVAWDRFDEIADGLLGPRWRRESRLGAAPGRPVASAQPFTPPPADLPAGPMEEQPAPVAPPPEPSVAPPPESREIPPPGPQAATPPTAVAPPVAVRRGRPADAAIRRRRVVAAGAAVAALALAAAAYAAAPTKVEHSPFRAPTSVSSPDVSFKVPAGWQRADLGGDLQVSGMDLKRPLAVTPPGGKPGEAVVAGMSSNTDPSLLPKAFRDTLGAEPRPVAVRLPAGAAFAYEGLEPRGATGPLTVAAVPTSDGVATLICKGAEVAGACDAVLRTFDVRARTYTPPPRAAYAKALNGVIARMAGSEQRLAPSLRHPRTAKALAAVLDDFERTYGDAAKAVGRIPTAPFERDETDAIAARLDRLHERYARLATAARANRRGAYARGRRAAERGRAALGRALRAVPGEVSS